MINIKELSVGNWVKFPHGIEKITDLSYVDSKGYASFIVGGTGADTTLLSANVEDLEPIPLTLEILKKNGWNEDIHHFHEDKNYNVELWKENNQIFWTINYCEYDIAKINYVHQLQNILTLYGIDKEIKI